MNNKPNINVTPLIDVLLVLLIIFMIVSPLKPADFKAKIPQKAKQIENISPNKDALVVALDSDFSLKLNQENGLGTIQNTEKLTARLAQIFQKRLENHDYAENSEFNPNLTESEKVQKTVFIKAPRSLDYGSVVKIIDAVKIAGASPISLQIDDLK